MKKLKSSGGSRKPEVGSQKTEAELKVSLPGVVMGGFLKKEDFGLLTIQ